MRSVRASAWLLLPAGGPGPGLGLQGLDPGGHPPARDPRPVIPGFFNLTMNYNPGAIFGTWAARRPWCAA